MQYSIVNKSKLHGNLRIDAEFYSPYFLQLEKTLNLHQTEAFSIYSFFIKKGIFDLSPDFYREEGVPLIRTSEIKDPQIDFSSTIFLDEKTQALNRKTELTPGDIVFTKIGAYIGDVAMLPDKYGRYNFSQNVTGVKLKKDMIRPGFLLAYLLSKYGNGQIKRIIMLSGQGKLELEDVKNIKVVLLGEKIQELTHKIILQAEFLKEKSVHIYREAEQILLSELNLLNWKPKHRLSFVKNFSDTQASERIDAEYFQPMYEEILNRSKDKVKTVRADEIFTFRRGDFIDTKYYTEQKTKRAYLRIKELSNIGSITSNEVIYIEDAFNNASQNTLKENDIVMAIIGDTIGKSNLIMKEFVGSYFSNNTGRFRLRPKAKDSYDPFYLEALFHSVYIQSQIERAKAQTGQPKIADKEVKIISIPCISLNKQKEIGNNIKKAIENKDKSKCLLDIAKRGVEMAIEKTEKDAQSWINAELKKLSVPACRQAGV